MARKILSDAFSVQFIMQGYATGRRCGKLKAGPGRPFNEKKRKRRTRPFVWFFFAVLLLLRIAIAWSHLITSHNVELLHQLEPQNRKNNMRHERHQRGMKWWWKASRAFRITTFTLTAAQHNTRPPSSIYSNEKATKKKTTTKRTTTV